MDWSMITRWITRSLQSLWKWWQNNDLCSGVQRSRFECEDDIDGGNHLDSSKHVQLLVKTAWTSSQLFTDWQTRNRKCNVILAWLLLSLFQRFKLWRVSDEKLRVSQGRKVPDGRLLYGKAPFIDADDLTSTCYPADVNQTCSISVPRL